MKERFDDVQFGDGRTGYGLNLGQRQTLWGERALTTLQRKFWKQLLLYAFKASGKGCCVYVHLDKFFE